MERVEAKKKEKSKRISISRVQLFSIPWAVAYQAPQSMEYIKGHLELPTKENALGLIAVDIGGKNTQE